GYRPGRWCRVQSWARVCRVWWPRAVVFSPWHDAVVSKPPDPLLASRSTYTSVLALLPARFAFERLVKIAWAPRTRSDRRHHGGFRIALTSVEGTPDTIGGFPASMLCCTKDAEADAPRRFALL